MQEKVSSSGIARPPTRAPRRMTSDFFSAANGARRRIRRPRPSERAADILRRKSGELSAKGLPLSTPISTAEAPTTAAWQAAAEKSATLRPGR